MGITSSFPIIKLRFSKFGNLSEKVVLFADQKDKMEAENQNLLLTFGSQLDHSLKDLHKTILGSVLQQTQQMRSMEEQFRANLASKCDVRNELVKIGH